MTRNYLSGSIKKALAIIECVGKSPKPLKASQVASITKLDRATAFRMRLDAHSCALGKAILAFKSRDELREIYKSYTLHKHTANTITSLDKLYINLDKVRKNGFSVNEAETFDYVYGIGAPIMDSQRRAIAGIAISGTKGSINVKTIPDLAKKVTNTAKLISQKLQES